MAEDRRPVELDDGALEGVAGGDGTHSYKIVAKCTCGWEMEGTRRNLEDKKEEHEKTCSGTVTISTVSSWD